MPCKKHPESSHPPPPLVSQYYTLFLFRYRKRKGNLKESPSPNFRGGGGVCKGYIKNCSEMMFPESKNDLKKKNKSFYAKNRENGRKSL